MAIRLEVKVENPQLSTHEGLRVSCSLRNENATSVEIPGPYDRSGAFRIGLTEEGAQTVRQVSRLTRQAVMSGARVDRSLILETVMPGQERSWKMDLSSYDYLVPAGRYQLRGVYEFPPAQVRLLTSPQALRVSEDPVVSVASLRDNPILDGLALLIEAEGAQGRRYYLRQHNYGRPIGAWYASRILADENPVAPPFCASCNFFQTADTAPFFQKWVLWSSDGSLSACLYERGVAGRQRRAALLPRGSRLIRTAVRTERDELYVFLWNESGKLECCRLEESRLAKLFEHELAGGIPRQVAIGADANSIDIAYSQRGIVHDRLDLDGRLLDRTRRFESRLEPFSLGFDAVERRILGVFRDGPRGRSLHLAAVDLRANTSSERHIDRLGLRHDVREVSFDQDRSGVFHLLVSTTAGRLYYWSDEKGPVLVARGEDRFFPTVVARRKIYLGCYRRPLGYRFLQYRRKTYGPKLFGLAPHA